MTTEPTWLPPGWKHPTRVELATGHHLRPVRATDVDLDMVAVMGSQPRLWSLYGHTRGWPPATMTAEQDRQDLARHEAAAERHESFSYALFDTGETQLLGCVYIKPPATSGADAEVSWWVVDLLVGGPVEAALAELVPRWLDQDWPFGPVRHIGGDLVSHQEAALRDITPDDITTQKNTPHPVKEER